MRRMLILVMLLTMVVSMGCAKSRSVDEDYANYPIADYPSNLPEGARVKILGSEWGGVVVGIKGTVVLFVEIYSGKECKIVDTVVTEDGWMTFTLPEGHWFSFVFKSHADDLWHYVYVAEANATMPMEWMDESITAYQPRGNRSSAMTARKFGLK